MSSSSNSDSGMDEQVEGDDSSWHPFSSFRTLNRQNILHHYLPIVGAGCYTSLSLHFVKRSLFQRVLPNYDPANLLLTGSLTGTCLYVYDRKHLKNAAGMQKVGFSLFASGMFNLGSLIIWAMIRGATSEKDTTGQVVRVALAVGSSILLVKTGIGYLQAIDDQIKTPK